MMDAAFTIGRYQVYRLEEWQGGFSPAEALFAEYEDAAFNQQVADFEPDFFRGGLIYGYLQSWLIDTGSERIIVDTGAGNDKDRPGIPIFGQLTTPFLDRLAAAGFALGDIDKVFCTHLHIDHVGWNTEWRDGGWQPTFPKARYYFPRADEEAWNPAKAQYATLAGAGVNANVFEDSVQPVIDAGMAELIDDGATIAPGMTALNSPGHTPGHMVLEVESDGDTALFTGDILHHPMQIARPDWNSVYCEDRVAAADTRRRILERASANGARIVPAHFGAPHSVFVERRDDGTFEPRYR
jgi:glyoxylase-like metal-dependent hydrolase (beta-lactamase superfamily II)